jgi:PST family polysaccharide transporter
MADPDVERQLNVFAQVRDRTVKGVLAMFLRQFIVMPVGLLATIFLSRILQPNDFGIYAIANFWIYIIVGFRDLGFGAALIQQKSEPSDDELNTIFTFQSIFVLVMVVGLFFLAELLTTVYRLDPRLVWVIRGLSAILLIGLLGSVPNILLERRLVYDVIAKIEVAAMLVFYIGAVTLALLGLGVWSFILGAIASELLRAALLFANSSWCMGFAWNRSFLRSALKFGSLYQLGGLTSLLRDNIAPLLAGPLFGPAAVGYLKWAERTAYLTSQVLTQIVTRVSFPSISRLQDHPEGIGQATRKMLRYLMLTTVPTLGVAAALIPWIIRYVFTNKWTPATIAFYWLTLRMLGGNITTPLIGVLNAMGRVKSALKILGVWTAFDWGLALLLAPWLGFNGVAVAYAIGVTLPVIWLLREVRQIATLDLQYALMRPVVAGGVAGLLTWFIGSRYITDLVSLLVVGLLGFPIYFLAILAMERGQLLRDVRAEAGLVKGILFSKAEKGTEAG